MLASTVASEEISEPCGYFYRERLNIPHRKIVFEDNISISDMKGAKYLGCSVILNSHIDLMKDDDKLPSFWPEENSELYETGWRTNHHYTADGPGSGRYAIVKNNITCIIDWDRHAWIDDKTGDIMHSDLINMKIKCFDGNLPNRKPTRRTR